MNPAKDASFFGHPRALSTLFFTEMWERFSYYGMRAILFLFMTTAIVDGGLGFTTARAGTVYGIYTSMVWLLPLAGGWLADNFLGLRRAVLYGGAVIMLGHILLAFHGSVTFYAGLGCVVAGTGLLKPNISAMVGQLYTTDDKRRDSGFSIFYMGINIGACLAPLVCGRLAKNPTFKGWLEGWGIDPTSSWHWGFAAAAVGMFFGLVQYVRTGPRLGEIGKQPLAATTAEEKARARRTLTISLAVSGALVLAFAVVAWRYGERFLNEVVIGRTYMALLFGGVIGFFVWLLSSREWGLEQRRRLLLVLVLFLGSCVFWSVFEQAGSTLTKFADESTRNEILGLRFESPDWQSVNAGLIVLLAPLFAWLWMKLGNFDRSSMIRFSIGILFAGLGFAVLTGGAKAAQGGALVGPGWLFATYLCHTIGELCLSPVGLSSMTRLAPQRVVGMMLGVWFASISVGSFLGGQVAGVYERFELPTLFALVAGSAALMALIMFLLARPVRGLLGVPAPDSAKG